MGPRVAIPLPRSQPLHSSNPGLKRTPFLADCTGKTRASKRRGCWGTPALISELRGNLEGNVSSQDWGLDVPPLILETQVPLILLLPAPGTGWNNKGPRTPDVHAFVPAAQEDLSSALSVAITVGPGPEQPLVSWA